MRKIAMLGSGLIGMFYTKVLHGQRSRDRVHIVYSRSEERAKTFPEEWNIPNWTTDMEIAITHPQTDVVVIGLPNNLHEQAVMLAAAAGKAVLCTKPLGRTAEEAKRMLDVVESRSFCRVSGRPGLYAENPPGDSIGAKWGAWKSAVGAFTGDSPWSSQRLVLGYEAIGWGGDH